EPINNYFPDDTSEFWGFDAEPVQDLVDKMWAADGWDEDSNQTDPMMNFTEKDLTRLAEEAGFEEIHVELRVDVEPGSWVIGWDALMGMSPNPNASTVAELIARALSPSEAERFEEHLR